MGSAGPEDVPDAAAAGDHPGHAPLARLEWLASGREGLLLIGAWAFAEAIVFPLPTDIGLLLLALLVPRRSAVLFGALVVGGLAGTAVLYAAAHAAPAAVTSMVLAIPGNGEPLLASARDLVAGGDPMSIAAFGPGTPLKVYTLAWVTGPATPVALLVGVALNRLTRVATVLVPLAALGWLAPGLVRRLDRWTLLIYGAIWTVVCAAWLK